MKDLSSIPVTTTHIFWQAETARLFQPCHVHKIQSCVISILKVNSSLEMILYKDYLPIGNKDTQAESNKIVGMVLNWLIANKGHSLSVGVV